LSEEQANAHGDITIHLGLSRPGPLVALLLPWKPHR